jgi:predicted transposase YbfD/YdcC
VIAIDGKTPRRSFDRAAKQLALHVVTAFAADARMVIGQVAASDKESEIIAARSLLGLLDLDGALVTGDALHCQGQTARLIKQRRGDWLFMLKDNRPAQRAEVASWFADPPSRPEPEHLATDTDHGRVEVRRHVVTHAADWLLSDRRHPDEARLPGLAMLGMVEATVTRDGKTSTLRRFYLSSARLDATAFAAAVRAHRRIEDSHHWVLNVSFDEDRARNRRDNAPENLATLRKLALNMPRAAGPDISIRGKRKRSGWSNDFARTILGHMR